MRQTNIIMEVHSENISLEEFNFHLKLTQNYYKRFLKRSIGSAHIVYCFVSMDTYRIPEGREYPLGWDFAHILRPN